MVQGKQQTSKIDSEIDVKKFLESEQPLILVLNSLHSGPHSNHVRMFKEYLEIEFEAKKTVCGGIAKHMFMHSVPAVPQQTNSFDCGLYLLKYLEKFLQHFVLNSEGSPEKIKWETWFEESETANMRQELRNLVTELSSKKNQSNSKTKVVSKASSPGTCFLSAVAS